MKVIDPVCGMQIDREEAAATESFHGRTFYFCSGSCRDKFRASPERYANKESDKSLARTTGDDRAGGEGQAIRS